MNHTTFAGALMHAVAIKQLDGPSLTWLRSTCYVCDELTSQCTCKWKDTPMPISGEKYTPPPQWQRVPDLGPVKLLRVWRTLLAEWPQPTMPQQAVLRFYEYLIGLRPEKDGHRDRE